jgi:hypothetical protein
MKLAGSHATTLDAPPPGVVAGCWPSSKTGIFRARQSEMRWSREEIALLRSAGAS